MDDNEEDIFPELVEAPPQPVLEFEDELIEDEEDEPIVPDIQPREKIEQNDIFISQKPKKNVKIVIEDNVEEEIPSIVAVKPVKKKRVMSEEHKKKLAIAREKAMLTRKANAIKRKEEKELEKEEKQLSTAMRRKRVSKMKEIVNDKPVSMKKPEVVEKVVEKQVYNQDDLNKAVLEGIAGYEKIRKERKSKKQEVKAEEDKKTKIFNTINNAVSGNRELDQWSHCFN